MHASPTVRLWADDDLVAPPKVVLFQLVRSPQFGDPLRRALARGRQALLGRQEPDGSFADPRPLDARSLATHILARAFLENSEPGQFRSAARGLLDLQRADGGWAASVGGDFDISASVLAYFALKLSGQISASEPMVCARRAILAGGGATKVDSIAKTWLALFGQLPYDDIAAEPSAPMESLSQAILAILRPLRHIRSGLGIRELLLEEPRRSRGRLAVAMKWMQRPLRKRALLSARRRFLAALGSVLANPAAHEAKAEPLAMVLVTLDALGYVATSSLRSNAEQQLSSMVDLDAEVAAFKSPAAAVTASIRTVSALIASGLDAGHAAVGQALSWVLNHSPQTTADAAMLLDILTGRVPAHSMDDVLPPPLRSCSEDDSMVEEPTDWAAHKGTLNKQLVNAQLPCGAWPARLDMPDARNADVGATAAALLALAAVDVEEAKRGLGRAARWFRSQQQADGSWPATANSSAIQSTSLVIRALIAAEDESGESISAGVDWLLAHQQSDGGWGDIEPGRMGIAGEAASSPRHTAAALCGLVAAGQGGSPAAARGAEYLIAAQTTCAEASTVLIQDTADSVLALAQYALRRPTPAAVDHPRLQIARISQD